MADVKDVGIGTIIALLLLEKVFAFLKPILAKRNGNGSSGERPESFWVDKIRTIVREELDNFREKLRADRS